MNGTLTWHQTDRFGRLCSQPSIRLVPDHDWTRRTDGVNSHQIAVWTSTYGSSTG